MTERSSTPPSSSLAASLPDRGTLAWSALLAAGLAAIAGGFALQATGGSGRWLSEQDAQRYIDATVALHGETVEPSDPAEHSHGDPSDLSKARAELAEAASRVDAARERQEWTPRLLQIGGVALVLGGAAGLRRGRPAPAR